MALVRILVDGYSLLHGWPELIPGRAPHSAAAREALVNILTQYHDATGIPITIVFDGAGAPAGTPKNQSTREVEILFSKAGQTADDIIERVAHRMSPHGQIMAVTDDFAERDTVIAFGGVISSCFNFIRTVESALDDLQGSLKHHNHTERRRFARSR